MHPLRTAHSLIGRSVGRAPPPLSHSQPPAQRRLVSPNRERHVARQAHPGNFLFFNAFSRKVPSLYTVDLLRPPRPRRAGEAGPGRGRGRVRGRQSLPGAVEGTKAK